jgi:pyruvate dehydrogenase E1 component beta subunit
MSATRVVDELNRSLHDLFDADPAVVLLGEDIRDPYGGAFGVTRGLSSRHPERVLGTPISEAAITGIAGGLAMCGDRAIVEVMFGDFVTLCFDPIVNFITKSVAMYGRRKPMRVLIRCPVGGNRGYGPTHSQSLQKHFVGVPHLRLYELSPLHPPGRVLDEVFAGDEPAVLFEDKVLYGLPTIGHGTHDRLFEVSPVDPDGNWVRVRVDDGPADWAVIAPGGLTHRAMAAIRTALIEDEVVTELLVPSRLYPVDLAPVLDSVAAARRVMVIEDGVAGGGWAAEVSRLLYEHLWGRLPEPVRLLQPPCAVIPAAPHLERRLLIQESTIHRALIGADHE